MKNFFVVPSDRYRYLHKFIQLENGHYKFVPEQEWMPLYVTMKEDNSGVEFIDTDGGPIISKGFKTCDFEVVDIINNDNIEFILKEL